MLAWTHLTPTCSVFFWGDIPILVKLSQILVFLCVFFFIFREPKSDLFPKSPRFWRKNPSFDGSVKSNQVLSNQILTDHSYFGSNCVKSVKSSTCWTPLRSRLESLRQRFTRVCRWRRRRMIYSHERVGGPGDQLLGTPIGMGVAGRVLKNIDWYCNEMMKRYP